MTDSGFSEYDVSWMCNECGEKWDWGDRSDGPCLATKDCPGKAMGLAFYKGPADGPSPVPFIYTVTNDDGTQTRYHSDGRRVE